MNFSQSQGGDSEARGRRCERTKEWECQMCTLLNTYKRKTCAACLSERAVSPDALSQAVPSTQTKKRIRLRLVSQINENEIDHCSNDDDDLDNMPLKSKKIHRVTQLSQSTMEAVSTDMHDGTDERIAVPRSMTEESVSISAMMDVVRKPAILHAPLDNKENEVIADESTSLETMRAKATIIHEESSKQLEVKYPRSLRNRHSLDVSVPLLKRHSLAASVDSFKAINGSEASSGITKTSPSTKGSVTSCQVQPTSDLFESSYRIATESDIVCADVVDVSASTLPPVPLASAKASALAIHHMSNVEEVTSAKPRGSFFYHISQDSTNLLRRRLRRKACGADGGLTSKAPVNGDNEITQTAIDIINSKWLTSNQRRQTASTLNEAGSAISLLSVVADGNPPQISQVAELSNVRRTSAMFDAPPPQPFKQEVSVLSQINVDKEVEAPSFQLLSFSMPSAPLAIAEKSIPETMTPVTSLPNGSQGAPSFDLLSGFISNQSRATPTIAVSQPSDYRQEVQAKDAVDDVARRRDSISSIYSKTSHIVNHFGATSPSTFVLRCPTNHHSSELVTSQASSNSDIALRQAGLDDSSDDEEVKPRKQLRANRLSVLSTSSTEWTCKWCTYVNEGCSTMECECCGQTKGSSMEQLKQTHTTNKTTPSYPKRSVVNVSNDDSSDASYDDDRDVEGPGWICKLCTYENVSNPTRCELCDTPKGSTMPSQTEMVQEYNHFDVDDVDMEFQVSNTNNQDVVDLTTASDGTRYTEYDDDSIEEISDTERANPSSPRDAPELREFTCFTPVATLRIKRDSIDYLSMFGANRGGKSYSDRLQSRIAESRRRISAEARGVTKTKPANGKRKKGSKKNRKSTGTASLHENGPASRSFPAFQKASTAVKRRAQPAYQFQSESPPRDGAPQLLNANLQPKSRTKSMRVVTEEGDFGAFRSTRSSLLSAPVESIRMTTWEGHGSMRYDDD
ncbi:hypothetical protein, variant [Aphanomyces invadans]|uniref:RanBP2-type domain-containing protein n=1 Tax=Aphanomyces invadans TaxID=157072 RepID=A0A024UNJ6_9STRA|nr:hypothetical protein, variant [Aphanomyces invadans]ETW07765.1 hypothetical protein, variant [Aphanomyces invadans]|eukprot:XP_008863858.1 hypothetical protein, variant [Aphanomyces invadans]